MKIIHTLPNKKTQTVGVFKEKERRGWDTGTVSTTDTSSLTTVSTTHLFNH